MIINYEILEKYIRFLEDYFVNEKLDLESKKFLLNALLSRISKQEQELISKDLLEKIVPSEALNLFRKNGEV